MENFIKRKKKKKKEMRDEENLLQYNAPSKVTIDSLECADLTGLNKLLGEYCIHG